MNERRGCITLGATVPIRWVLIYNMGSCSRPGEYPDAWKQVGPKPDPGN